MLFLLKRQSCSALTALIVLSGVGLLLRHILADCPPWTITGRTLGLGVVVFCAIVLSDGILHGLLTRCLRDWYTARYRELAGEFRGQSVPAILSGAMMAGLGEELLFRGVSVHWVYLSIGAVVFGLLHHIRMRLWIFTLWSVWQGMLIALGLAVTGDLGVTMTAHFLHDLTGFLIFRRYNRQSG